MHLTRCPGLSLSLQTYQAPMVQQAPVQQAPVEAPVKAFAGGMRQQSQSQTQNFLALQQQAVQQQLQFQQFLQFQQAQQVAMAPAAQQPDIMDLATLQSQLSALSFDGGNVGPMHGLQSGPYHLSDISLPQGWGASLFQQ